MEIEMKMAALKKAFTERLILRISNIPSGITDAVMPCGGSDVQILVDHLQREIGVTPKKVFLDKPGATERCAYWPLH